MNEGVIYLPDGYSEEFTKQTVATRSPGGRSKA